ncbi:MAG TPA: IclR family transcriptional regulator [Acidimicrobiales bacterium]|jgi:IclR family acetate operon transcriptional repressor|nr:IclR family transcriptional regulator [Acidimicrobiales bacterium]
MEPDNAYSIRAVQRVCDILELLHERPDGVSLLQVAQVTALPKSSAFRYLATLEARRYIERDAASGDYRLGLAFLPLQARRLDLLAQRARPRLEALRDRFEETVNLGLLDGTRVIYLDIVESPKSMRLAARPGDRDHVHSTALGKAITAHLPEDRVKAIVAGTGMPALTPNTITDEARFFDELTRVRKRGYALDNGENEPDGRCVGVSILRSRFPAALSFSAPVSRFPLGQVQEVAAALQEVADKLGDDFGGGDAPDDSS